MEPVTQLGRVVLAVSAALARDQDAGGRDACEACEADDLP
jgi:hypothetical protein